MDKTRFSALTGALLGALTTQAQEAVSEIRDHGTALVYLKDLSHLTQIFDKDEAIRVDESLAKLRSDLANSEQLRFNFADNPRGVLDRYFVDEGIKDELLNNGLLDRFDLDSVAKLEVTKFFPGGKTECSKSDCGSTGCDKTGCDSTNCGKTDCSSTDCGTTGCGGTNCSRTDCANTACGDTSCSATACAGTHCGETRCSDTKGLRPNPDGSNPTDNFSPPKIPNPTIVINPVHSINPGVFVNPALISR